MLNQHFHKPFPLRSIVVLYTPVIAETQHLYCGNRTEWWELQAH